MGMGFLSNMAPDDDDDKRKRGQAGPSGDPVARFTAAAAEVGLIRPGDKLDRNVIELCLRVVEMAAQVGDKYTVRGYLEDTVGAEIRAELAE